LAFVKLLEIWFAFFFFVGKQTSFVTLCSCSRLSRYFEFNTKCYLIFFLA